MWKKLITPVTILALALFFALAALMAWGALAVMVLLRARMDRIGLDNKPAGLPIPVHILMAVGYTLATMLLFWCRRRLQRRLAGQCLTCGYDLRASPERCPECGTAPRARSPTRRFSANQPPPPT
jgi:hypothetical protein